MKIEKISDNQICCTLTLADLISNRLHLGDLAGNTDRVREFFTRLMLRARKDFGFEFEDGPLIIEAVHQPPDSMKLFITKANEDGEFDESPLHNTGGRMFDNAMDIGEIIRRSLNRANAESNEKTQSGPESSDLTPVIPAAFRFNSLENVILAAKALKGSACLSNSLYRDTAPGYYLVILSIDDMADPRAEAMANVLSEYSQPSRISPSSESYLTEHGLLMIRDNALETMADF